MSASPKPSVVVRTTEDATWEVRRTDTDEQLGTFPSKFWAEMFRDTILDITRETAPRQIAA